MVLAGCGGEPKLTVSFYDDVQRGREILVSVPPDLNKPSTAKGAEQVRVQCFDRDSDQVLNEPYTWPFESDGVGDNLPHAHIRGLPEILNAVTRCKLLGTDPPLEGELPLAR